MVNDTWAAVKNRHKERLISTYRDANRKRMIQYRRKIRIVNRPNVELRKVYRTDSALTKAVEKVKSAFPRSHAKRKAVLVKLFHEMEEDDQIQIILGNSFIKHKTGHYLSEEIIQKVHLFYERDDISRMSPEVKHTRKYLNSATGKKEIKQMRFLMYRLSEVHNLFIAEQATGNGNFPLVKSLSLLDNTI